ncbi:MAG: hypothetical protein ACJ8FY_19450 [Gemmataceae bacterium]
MVSAADALKEVSAQTKIAVEDRRRKKTAGTIDLRLKDVGFWQALDTIARQADARLALYERDGVPALVDGPHVLLPVSYNGVFRIGLKRLVAYRDLETATAYQVATMEIAWAPRYRPFLLETRPKALVLKDDQNHDVAIKEEGGGQAPVEGRLAMTFEVRLPAIPRPALRIRLLKGELSVIGANKMLTLTFDTLDALQKDAGKRVLSQEGITAKVSKIQLEADIWTVEMTLDYPPGGPKFESFQSWVVNNEIYLQSASSEKRLRNNGGYTLESSSSNRAVLSYYFKDEKGKGIKRGKPADWKLVYVTPGVISETSVPFSFKDVKLP